MEEKNISELNVHEKISLAITRITEMKLEKKGKNDFAQSRYYLPEDISNAVKIVSEQLGLLNMFSLKRNDYGIYGELKVLNISSEVLDQEIFELAIDIPPLKGDNLSMRYGATLTFCKRYMFQNVYEITDNSLIIPPAASPPSKRKNNESGLNRGDFIKMNESERCSYILNIVNNRQFSRAYAALEYCIEHNLLSKTNIDDLKSFLKVHNSN